MRYVSTRGGMPPHSFTSILLEGLAPDGGLAVPESYPRFTPQDLARLRPLGYRELAFEILSRYMDDIAPADLRAIIDRTYTAAVFGSDEITPVVDAASRDCSCCALSNGPTLAFKDVALQLLGNLFEYVLAKQRRDAQHPRRDLGRHRAVGRVRDARQARRPRVHALAARQDEPVPDGADVLAAGSEHLQHRDRRRVRRLPGHRQGGQRRCRVQAPAIASARSIRSTGRASRRRSCITSRATSPRPRDDGEQVSFSVPSGNFGNIFAGHVARQMGLPIRKLILATNENDVLDEFFKSGRYRVRNARARRGRRRARRWTFPRRRTSSASCSTWPARDAGVVRALWQQVEQRRRLRSRGTPLAHEAARGRLRVGSQHARRPRRDHPRRRQALSA